MKPAAGPPEFRFRRSHFTREVLNIRLLWLFREKFLVLKLPVNRAGILKCARMPYNAERRRSQSPPVPPSEPDLHNPGSFHEISFRVLLFNRHADGWYIHGLSVCG
jgi:hypothetical protein